MKAKSASLLDIEKIVSASESSKMSSNFMAKNAQPLERLSNKLYVSKAQAILFAFIANSSCNEDCSLSDIKQHLGSENLDMLQLSLYVSEFEFEINIRMDEKLYFCKSN